MIVAKRDNGQWIDRFRAIQELNDRDLEYQRQQENDAGKDAADYTNRIHCVPKDVTFFYDLAQCLYI